MTDLSNLKNHAAFIPSPKAPSFTIDTAPVTSPQRNQILIRNSALAINPIDYKLFAYAVYPIAYPAIIGQDVAGTVVAVGSALSQRFKVGDRAFGCTAGFATKQQTEKAFQEYTILEGNLAAKIPEGVKETEAAVLPLATTTAAAGLFNKDFLGLQLPSLPFTASKGNVDATTSAAPQTVIVWGGASSVGSCAIQLARCAGYSVITTASPKNHEYVVTDLGAKAAFDYNSPDVVEQILAACGGDGQVAGIFDAVGGKNAWSSCLALAEQLNNYEKEFVATVTPGFPTPTEGSRVTIKQFQSLSIRNNGVGEALWGNGWLEEAIAQKSYRCLPPAEVVGHGLESVQGAVEKIGQGVSRTKIVVTL